MSGLGKMRAQSQDGVIHAVAQMKPVTARSKPGMRQLVTVCGLQLFVLDEAQQPREEVGCMTCMAHGA